MTATKVDDSELLYRSVRADDGEFTYIEGKLVFTANAFRDRSQKPSVDRSSLRPNPVDARMSPTDGIATLITEDVRAIATVRFEQKEPGKQERKNLVYGVDVVHRPLTNPPAPKDNPAHCQVECNPEITNNHARKLKEALAILATNAGWTVEPTTSEASATKTGVV